MKTVLLLFVPSSAEINKELIKKKRLSLLSPVPELRHPGHDRLLPRPGQQDYQVLQKR